jgi:outer membrane protein assembly factor BamB
MVDRHNRTASPLVVGGRLFFTGRNLVGALDAFNGSELWRRNVPGSMRLWVSKDSGNMAASDDTLYVVAGGQCLALDAATGRQTQSFRIELNADSTTETSATDDQAKPSEKHPARWGYVAHVDETLLGSVVLDANPRRTVS